MAATHNSKTPTRTVVLYLAFELGETEWKLALTIGVGQKPRLRSMPARDLPRLYEEIAKAKRRFGFPMTLRRLPHRVPQKPVEDNGDCSTGFRFFRTCNASSSAEVVAGQLHPCPPRRS